MNSVDEVLPMKHHRMQENLLTSRCGSLTTRS